MDTDFSAQVAALTSSGLSHHSPDLQCVVNFVQRLVDILEFLARYTGSCLFQHPSGSAELFLRDTLPMDVMTSHPHPFPIYPYSPVAGHPSVIGAGRRGDCICLLCRGRLGRCLIRRWRSGLTSWRLVLRWRRVFVSLRSWIDRCPLVSRRSVVFAPGTPRSEDGETDCWNCE